MIINQIIRISSSFTQNNFLVIINQSKSIIHNHSTKTNHLLLNRSSSSSSSIKLNHHPKSINIMSNQSKPIVIFGPSGTGKSTLLKKLQSTQHWSKFGFSVSHTTRKPREGEQDGIAYHFINKDEFEKMIQDGAFIEHAQFGGNYYGTSIKAISDVSEKEGKRCILDIDAQGVKLILKNHSNLNPLIIFISPPSMKILKHRLESRGTETDQTLQSRLSMAQSEIEYASSGVPDLIILNDDLNKAYQKFESACIDDQLPESDTLPTDFFDS